jgi:hypothetical protein
LACWGVIGAASATINPGFDVVRLVSLIPGRSGEKTAIWALWVSSLEIVWNWIICGG